MDPLYSTMIPEPYWASPGLPQDQGQSQGKHKQIHGDVTSHPTLTLTLTAPTSNLVLPKLNAKARPEVLPP